MRWAGAAASLLAVAALLWGSATPARACLYDGDYDPIAQSDLIVGGRLGQWAVASDIPLPDILQVTTPTAVAIRVPMSVGRVFKGSSSPEIELIDFRAVDLVEGEYSWSYSTWDCGFFASRSTPPEPYKYVIFGLDRRDGMLREQWTFFAGPEPTGDRYNEALIRLKDAQDSSAAPALPLAVAAITLPLVFVLAASFVFPAKGPRP